MKDFENRLRVFISRIPLENCNMDFIQVFKLGARWAEVENREDKLSEIMKADEKDGIYQDATRMNEGSID